MDAAIERLGALKLQEQSNGTTASAASHHDEHHQNQQQQLQHSHPHANGHFLTQQQHEMQQMRTEFERRVCEHEQQMHQWQHEMHALRTRLAATEHENHALREVVKETEAYKLQIQDQQLVIDELQGQVKQLRLTNYRLQFVVQQSEPRGHNTFLPPRPPDIF